MRTCTICKHKKRQFIEAALAVGESFRHVAERFHVSTSALVRHKQQHMQPIVEQVQQERQANTKQVLSSALDRVKRDTGLVDEALEIIWSPAGKDVEQLIPVLRESRHQNRLFAMLTGELRRNSITDTPEWQEAIGSFFERLASRFPAAHDDMLIWLEEERAKRRRA